jgi:hypothetical protein
MGINLSQLAVTISNGTSLSPAVGLGDGTLVGLAMSAGWDAAGLSFQVSIDGGITWLEMESITAAVSFTAAASQFIAIDPAIWRGVNHIKVRSGTAASPVLQTAVRALTLITRRF